MDRVHEIHGKSDFEVERIFNDSQPFEGHRPGQSCPQHCPHPETKDSVDFSDPLGEPLTIREVARLIGCSSWTIRHRYLRRGLPHFRSTPQGKLLFYKNQVVHWLLTEQRKGGINP